MRGNTPWRPGSVREKAHRLPREAYRGEVAASITICVDRRAPLFTDQAIVSEFAQMLRAAAERWSCLVLVYCFMPDHLHLVLQGRGENADLWKMLVDYNQKTGYRLSLNLPRVSWQKDFHDHVIRRSEDLTAHIRYILDNPCRRALASEWQDYPFQGAIGCELGHVLEGIQC